MVKGTSREEKPDDLSEHVTQETGKAMPAAAEILRRKPGAAAGIWMRCGRTGWPLSSAGKAAEKEERPCIRVTDIQCVKARFIL